MTGCWAIARDSRVSLNKADMRRQVLAVCRCVFYMLLTRLGILVNHDQFSVARQFTPALLQFRYGNIDDVRHIKRNSLDFTRLSYIYQ